MQNRIPNQASEGSFGPRRASHLQRRRWVTEKMTIAPSKGFLISMGSVLGIASYVLMIYNTLVGGVWSRGDYVQYYFLTWPLRVAALFHSPVGGVAVTATWILLGPVTYVTAWVLFGLWIGHRLVEQRKKTN